MLQMILGDCTEGWITHWVFEGRLSIGNIESGGSVRITTMRN